MKFKRTPNVFLHFLSPTVPDVACVQQANSVSVFLDKSFTQTQVRACSCTTSSALFFNLCVSHTDAEKPQDLIVTAAHFRTS